jgi:Arc/MetJ-type ribon-helix-helix transcriptional regulator
MAESVTARLSDSDIKAIDALIAAGNYTTRSDFLRAASRHLLREEAQYR